jgi:hypothetical protein
LIFLDGKRVIESKGSVEEEQAIDEETNESNPFKGTVLPFHASTDEAQHVTTVVGACGGGNQDF